MVCVIHHPQCHIVLHYTNCKHTKKKNSNRCVHRARLYLCPLSHIKGPLTTSSITSLMAMTRRIRERGTMVVNRPVGDTPGNCFTRKRRRYRMILGNVSNECYHLASFPDSIFRPGNKTGYCHTQYRFSSCWVEGNGWGYHPIVIVREALIV